MKDLFGDDEHIPYSSDLITILKEKSPRAAMALAALQAASPGVRYAQSVYRTHRLYTLRCRREGRTDGLYEELHEWVLDELPARARRALTIHSSSDRRIRVRYDGSRTQVITVRGFRVKVTANDGGDVPSPGGKKAVFPEICFSVYSEKARDALLCEMEEILRASAEKTREPTFYMLDKWDDWSRVENLIPRTLDSVILPGDQLERVISDLGRFFASEADYVRRSVPWHRGHLYTGSSGTGKTSLARAVAHHFSLNTWYVPLSDVKSDADLIGKVSGIYGGRNIGGRNMLLLEDIDVFRAAAARTEGNQKSNEGSTLSGVLNALDGFTTPHGLVYIMTTNHPERLDGALLRSGRADLTEHFTLSGAAEARRLISRWFDSPCPVIRGDLEMSPSDISEICKRQDSAQAAAEVLNGTS